MSETITVIYDKRFTGLFGTRHLMKEYTWQLRKCRNKRHQWCIVRDRDGLVLAMSKDFAANIDNVLTFKL